MGADRARPIEALIDLPSLSDPKQRATLDVLMAVAVPAMISNPNLLALAAGRAANVCLEYGNGEASPFTYTLLGWNLGSYFGEYQSGYIFGKLGYDLLERSDLPRFRAEVYVMFGQLITPWVRHVREAIKFLRRAFDVAKEVGNLNYASYSLDLRIADQIAAGDHLADVQEEAERALEFVRKAKFGLVIDILTSQLGLVRTLRGLTPVFGSFDGEGLDEGRFEAHLERNPPLAVALFLYRVRKLQACVLSNDFEAASAAATKAHALLWAAPGLFEVAEHHFYAALACAGRYAAAPAEERRQCILALRGHSAKLEIWAANCPENFENRAALVGAEIARLEGRELDAEVSTNRRFARPAPTALFIMRRSPTSWPPASTRRVASRQMPMRICKNARYGYLRWGADGKVQQLDQLYPQLRQDERAPGPAATIGAPVEHLDLATVMKVSQAVSGEIVLEKMLDTLMRTALQQAGAERGLLILPRGAGQRIEAEATTSGDTVVVRLCDEAVAGTALPEGVLHYVLRTREGVILDDAAAETAFSADPYIRQHGARSILCLPLLNQAKLIGVLYLENNLAPHVFAPARIAVLKLLASQAAVALENTRLYRDLEQREAKIRRLVEANVIGIFIFALDGRIIEANDAFLQMVGYDREDLISGRLRWTDLTPPEWRDHDARAVAEVKLTGRAQPYEKEYIRKDGGRVPVLIGVAMFEEDGNEGVAFVLDLTERKRAEAEARRNERRYREMQMELAHTNRVATIGQLTASIAHEVNQPITGTIISAQAALRWLDARPPKLEEARQALGRIIKDGNRAGEVIGRTRGLIKKAPPRQEALAINQAILEVIALLHGEVVKHGISVQTQLADDVPVIHGDRVQLQQVIFNLIMNAIQAMSGVSEGTRDLLISTGRAEPDSVFVAVRDSGRGWRRRFSSACSSPSTLPSPADWGWGCRSANPSWKRTADDCGRPRTCPAALNLISRCPPARTAQRAFWPAASYDHDDGREPGILALVPAEGCDDD